MDVSGTMDNYKYLAIVIGQKENLNSLYHKIGSPQRHMSGQSRKKKNRIIRNLMFDGVNRTALCVKLERKKVIKTLKSKRAKKYNRQSGGKLFSMFETTLFKYLRTEIEKFTSQYNRTPTRVIVECEKDSRNFAKAWGVKTLEPASIHIISDIVAWCNNKGENIDGVIELDLSEVIQNKLLKKLQK